MKLRLEIEGMSCDHCVSFVEKSLKEIDGIQDVSVSLGSAVIDVDESVTEGMLREVIEDAGFELSGIMLSY